MSACCLIDFSPTADSIGFHLRPKRKGEFAPLSAVAVEKRFHRMAQPWHWVWRAEEEPRKENLCHGAEYPLDLIAEALSPLAGPFGALLKARQLEEELEELAAKAQAMIEAGKSWWHVRDELHMRSEALSGHLCF